MRSAEESKIALSEQDPVAPDLSYIEPGLTTQISAVQLEQAIARPLERITRLMEEAIAQAGEQPDVIFVTGGSARSPLIRQAVARTLGDIPILDGDHFGSVTAGLTEWADKIYR